MCVNDFRIVPTVWYLYAFYLINSVLQIMIKNIMVKEIRYTYKCIRFFLRKHKFKKKNKNSQNKQTNKQTQKTYVDNFCPYHTACFLGHCLYSLFHCTLEQDGRMIGS